MTDPTAPQPAATPGRRLATVETITSLRDIPDADLIVCARIRGWDVVVKRGEFAVGDRCVYVEVDALLDVTDDRFAFLAARGVRTDANGRTGHVLKTARLRGQYSQGLALPFDQFPELPTGAEAGVDVTDALDIVKWDPPIPASLTGVVRGLLPSWIPTTDEERIQNNPAILTATGPRWVATEKVDGTSTTVYVDPSTGVDGVCSRNLDLLPAEGNTLWRMAARHDLHAKLKATYPGRRAAVQGETYGEGIQGNPLKVRGHHFAAFTLRVDGAEEPRALWPEWLLELAVPTHPLPFPTTLDDALEQVEKLASLIAPGRPAEGVVWRASDVPVVSVAGQRLRASFKAISNRYLLKHDR